MKTGKFLKFQRPSGEVHAYLYLEGGLYRAAVYVAGAGAGEPPLHAISGPDQQAVEQNLRAWIDRHYPRAE